ncbi:MAG TPA: monovalent cation/H(+) antiporter subunit G [Polyangium sp.]|nr:monovalent cation/H(+) antiporter subunit G [Polyangium sp.]
MVIDSIEMAALVLGAFFMFVASLGVLRLADFYTRIHAPTKAATLGLAFFLVALAIHLRYGAGVAKALLAMLFVGMTAPVGAHILARAAYRNGVRPTTKFDEYAPFAEAHKDTPDRSKGA